jgi:hypothetical protein
MEKKGHRTALKVVEDLYREGRGGRDLTADLALYLQYGFVHCTPDVMILARPVYWADGVRSIVSFGRVTPPDEADTWLVWMAAVADGRQFVGDHETLPQYALRLAPYWLPQVAWHRVRDRETRIRCYRWEAVQRLAGIYHGWHKRNVQTA